MSAKKLRLLALLAVGTIGTAVTPLASLAATPIDFGYQRTADWYGTHGTPVDRHGTPVDQTVAPCRECVWVPAHEEQGRYRRVWVPGHWERVPGYRPEVYEPRPGDHRGDG